MPRGGGEYADGSSRASIDPAVFPSTMCYCVAPSLYDFKPTEEEHEGGRERRRRGGNEYFGG